MTLKCYDKPNRTKIRVFTARDVHRISRYAMDDGASAVDILAGVAVFTGFGWILCVASKMISNATRISKIITTIAGSLGVAALVDFLLKYISLKLFVKLPLPRRVLLIIVILALFFRDIASTVKSELDKASLIVEASDYVHSLCVKAREIAVERGESTADYLDDKAEDVGNELRDLIDQLRW